MTITKASDSPGILWFSGDVSCKIFSYLELGDFGSSCMVTRSWRVFIEDLEVWQRWAQDQLNMRLDDSNVKDFLIKHFFKILKSNDEIVSRVEAFVNKIPLGCNGKFVCRFGVGQEYENTLSGLGREYRYLTVEIKGDRTIVDFDNREIEFDVREIVRTPYRFGEGRLSNPELRQFNFNTYIGGNNSVSERILLNNERFVDFEKAPLRAIITVPIPLESETDFATGQRYQSLSDTTDIQCKIENICIRKLKSLNDTRPSLIQSFFNFLGF